MPRYFFNLAPGQPTDEEDEELPYDAAAIELARQTVADMSRDGPFTIPEECVIVSKEDGSVVGEVYLEELGIAPELRLVGLECTVLPGSPPDFGKLIAEEVEKWRKVNKFAGI